MGVKQVAVLGFQGDFGKHFDMLSKIPDVTPSIVKSRQEIEAVDALILPGGESTTMGKFLVKAELLEYLREKIEAGFPVFGTCAGLILLAKELKYAKQPGLFVLDVTVQRNAYGRQLDSFDTKIKLHFTDHVSKAVFIRAPKITRIGTGVEVLGAVGDDPVLVRQGNILGCAFHPELTADTTIHEYFCQMI